MAVNIAGEAAAGPDPEKTLHSEPLYGVAGEALNPPTSTPGIGVTGHFETLRRPPLLAASATRRRRRLTDPAGFDHFEGAGLAGTFVPFDHHQNNNPPKSLTAASSSRHQDRRKKGAFGHRAVASPASPRLSLTPPAEGAIVVCL